MTFQLSTKSLTTLIGVDDRLVRVVLRAIKTSNVDFGVIEGRRTLERQRELVAAGASQTLLSKHIDGHAVDLMAYIGPRASWELNLYDDIADAMKAAAIAENVGLRWGAAWSVNDIRNWPDTMAEAMNAYIDKRRNEGKRPFIDAPHFELL